MKQPKQHTSKSQKPTYRKITPAQEQGKHNTTSKQNLLTQAQAKTFFKNTKNQEELVRMVIF